MDEVIERSTASTGGIVLLTVVGIVYGGTFLLKVVTRKVPANELQQSFFRAGHAHAGVLVILGIVVNLYVDFAGVTGLGNTLAPLVLVSAILVPAGFFLSVSGTDPQRPNRAIALVWAGVAALVTGLVGAGVGLLTA